MGVYLPIELDLNILLVAELIGPKLLAFVEAMILS